MGYLRPRPQVDATDGRTFIILEPHAPQKIHACLEAFVDSCRPTKLNDIDQALYN